MGVGDGTGYGATIGRTSQPKQLAASRGVGGRCVCICVWCCSRVTKQLVVMCWLRLEKPYVFMHTSLWPLYLPSSNLTPTSHPHSPPLPHFCTAHTHAHTHSNSTLSWFINEQIARGDGKRRLDDLRVIEVDAREDEKCVCACVLCLCAFEGRIEANGWDGEKWDWTSREISIRAACVPSCPWEGVRPRAGRWSAQRTAVLLCLIKPMLRISSRPPHLSSSSSQSAVNLRVRAAAFLRMSACCEFSTLISWRPPHHTSCHTTDWLNWICTSPPTVTQVFPLISV